MLKIGVIEDTYDRDRRANREKKQEKLDIEMIGSGEEEKEKSNQATRKIKWAVDEKRRKAKRAEKLMRVVGRNERTNIKLSNPLLSHVQKKYSDFLMNLTKKIY